MTPIRLRIEPPGGVASRYERQDGVFTLGRGSTADVVIPDSSMSRQHARFVLEDGRWVVEDLGARNGTYVNGQRIRGRSALSAGDLIRLGATTVHVTLPSLNDSSDDQSTSAVFRSVSTLTQALERADPGRLAARLKALNEFHRAMAEPISLDVLLERLLDQLFTALQVEEGMVLLRQPDGSLAPAASRRPPGARGELVVSRRLVNEVVDKDAVALVTDLRIDRRFTGADSILGSGIRSLLAAPISDTSGCIGMIAVYSRAGVKRFGEDDLELIVSLASAAALRIRNVALAEEAAARRVHDRELALAHEIQMGMLPRPFVGPSGVQLSARLIPARAVGGDLYDYLLVGDRLWFIVADAAGKGVGAALFMTIARTLFRALVHDASCVSSVLERINAELARDNDRQLFVTAVAGCLDLPSGSLTLVNAGHLSPLRVTTSGTVAQLDPPSIGIALGILEDARYVELDVPLVEGDQLVIVSDGVTDAVDRSGERFGDARLAGTLARLAPQGTDDVVRGVVSAVTGFAATAPQEDDLTVLAVRYR